MAQAEGRRSSVEVTSVGARISAADDVGATQAVPDYPVREYVGAMAGELARMARWDGDEKLALLLEIAARLAGEPQDTSPL